MRAFRALAAMLALAAATLAMPVRAEEPALTLGLAQRWQAQAPIGTWTVYEATVQNEGGSDFTGEVDLYPASSRTGPQLNLWPRYRTPLTIARSTARSLAFYVLQAPTGYQAEIRQGGHTLATAAPAPAAAGAGAHAIGLLSDVHDGESRITSLRPISAPGSVAITRFPGAQSFPANAVYLSGLSAIVIDDFDSGSLSQAQVQSLRDFVGLGGTLISSGGGAWRRTLQPLPAELLPLRPTASAVTSLAPLAALGGLGPESAELSAPIATGELRAGRVVLGAPGSPPLEVEAAYGAGRVVEMLFDPFAAPLDSSAEMATLSWSQALTRAVAGSPPSGARGFGPAASSRAGGLVPAAAVRPLPVAAAVPQGGAVFPPGGPADTAVFALLRDTPEAAVPPLALMAGLLAGYIALTGPVAYFALSAIRRRELMWVAVPALAVLFTGFAYGAGIGSRGNGFLDNMVEIQRLGPDGVMEAQGFHGLFAPHRGDFTVTLPANTLVTTSIGSFENFAGAGTRQPVVTGGSRPELTVNGVAVWSMQTVQTLAVTHQPVAVEAHVAITGNTHLHATVVNRSPYTLERMEIVAAETGAVAPLPGSLAPGAGITVDSELVARGATSLQPIKGGPSPGPSTAPAAAGKKDSVIGLAASEAVTARPGGYSLVAVSAPLGSLQVGSQRPSRSSLAALIAPISVDSTDSLPASGLRARLVSSYFGSLKLSVDVYDLAIPAGYGGAPRLGFQLPVQTAGQRLTVQSIEVYNWSDGSWRSLPRQGAANQSSATDLLPGELAGAMVRVRATESNPESAAIRLLGGGTGG